MRLEMSIALPIQNCIEQPKTRILGIYWREWRWQAWWASFASWATWQSTDWHASIRNEQNHFTQGDLPRFIRKAYENCKGPPRLFLLDRFDVAGTGACLKRYTDPFFFKMVWASSELLKAEKEKMDKKALYVKKKGRRRRSGEIKAGASAPKLYSRVRYPLLNMENPLGAAALSQNLNFGLLHKLVNNSATLIKGNTMQALSSKAVPAYSGGTLPPDIGTSSWNESSTDGHSEPLTNVQDIKADSLFKKFVKAEHNIATVVEEHVGMESKPAMDASSEVLSDTEQFVDALSMMESDMDSDLYLDAREEEGSVDLNPSASEDRDMLQEQTGGIANEEAFDAEKDLISIQPATEGLEPVEKLHFAPPCSNSMKTGLFLSSLNGSNMPSFFNRLRVSSLQKREHLFPSVKEGICSCCPPNDKTESASILEDYLEPMTSFDDLSETLPSRLKILSTSFDSLPNSAIPLTNGDQSRNFCDIGSLASINYRNSTEMLIKSDFEQTRCSLEEPEQGLNVTPDKFSPRSLAESAIEPMHLVTESSMLHGTLLVDDSDFTMETYSSSSSDTISALSSPQILRMATSEFNKVLEVRPKSPLSNVMSSESSPTSPIFNAFHSPPSSLKLTPDFVSSLEPKMQSFHSEPLFPSSPILSPMAEPPELPPFPPLPPLKWRMRSCHNVPLPNTRTVDSSFCNSPLCEVVPPPTRPAPPVPSPRPVNIVQDSFTSLASTQSETKDSIIEAITSHNRSSVKIVRRQSHSPKPNPEDGRQVLFEQIRTRSFSLRHIALEKSEASCPVTRINVAAILEKANAIRQALAESDGDDDDDWSDT